MLKIIDYTAVPDVGQAQVALVKVSSRGLIGSDLADFGKRAGTGLLSRIEDVELHPGEALMHLYAMGSTEALGPNRNGDGFKRAMLQRFHPTFVSDARLYRNHLNTDPAKSYGVVKASNFRDDVNCVELLVAVNGTKEAADRNGGLVGDLEMDKLASGRELPVSMAIKVPNDHCFRAGTLVETADGDRAIEQIAIGDMVRTHTGALRPVKTLFKNPYAGTMVDLTVTGVDQVPAMTAGHPVMVVRRTALEKCRGSVAGRRRRHTVRRNSSACTTCEKPIAATREWLEAQDVRVGDWLVFPVQQPGTVTVDRDLAYLAGFYAGDGCPVRQGRGRKKRGEKYLVATAFDCDISNQVVIDSLVAAIERFTGRTPTVRPYTDGRQAVRVTIYDQSLAKQLIELVGEGSLTKRLSPAIFNWDTPSRLAMLAGHLDSDGCVDLAHRTGTGRHATSNRDLGRQIQQLWWGAGHFVGFYSQTGIATYADTPATGYIVSLSNSAAFELRDVSAKAAGITAPSSTRSRGFLLDGYMHLPVAETRHYYDELDVFNLHVDVDETYTVGFVVHNCSYCGNVARSPREYCAGQTCKAGGLRTKMGKVVNVDGGFHHLHADNREGRFFDITHVFPGRQADRIAYVTGLLKSAGDYSGAGLAEALCLDLPQRLLELPEVSSHEVRKMAEWVRRAASAESKLHSMPRLSEDIELTTVPGGRATLEDALCALKQANVLLPLTGFLQLCTGLSSADSVKVASKIRPALDGIFTALRDSETLAETLEKCSFVPGPRTTPAHTQWAKSQTKFAMTEKALFPRLASAQPIKKAAVLDVGVDQAARELATEFALYKIGFLAARNPDSELTLRAAVIQN